MLRSLRAQLSLTILFIVLVTVCAISAFSNWFINYKFEDYITRQENERSINIVSNLGNQFNPSTNGWDANLLHTIGMQSLYDGYIVKIYDAYGNMLWDAENHDMTLCMQIMDDITERMSNAQRLGDFITNSYDIVRDGTKIGAATITSYGPFFFTENDYQFIKTLNIVLFVIGALAAALAILAGTVFARNIASPISKTAYIAAQISSGNYKIRFENTPNTSELQDMVTAINHLAEGLFEQENLRKRLTSDVAHELRTPLSAVGAHLEAMIDGIWEPTPERLKSCHEEIKRLGILVNDLQRLANLEDGNQKLNKTKTDLYEAAQTALRNLEPKALEKQLSISIHGAPVFVYADRERIMQVIVNLVSNAIYYTPAQGVIQLTVSQDQLNGILEVEDNGIGIPENELPFVFERFYRTDKSRNRRTGGTGIGLTIARSIVEAHNGKIFVHSKLNCGSCFSIAFPKFDHLQSTDIVLE